MKGLWATFTFGAFGMTMAQGASLAGADLGPLASPEAFFVEHLFITGIGAWGLIELIKQGKRMATREDVSKLRDDTTAVLLEHQTRADSRFTELHERIDALMERRKR